MPPYSGLHLAICVFTRMDIMACRMEGICHVIYKGSMVAKCDPLSDPDALIIVAQNSHSL